MGVSLSKLTWHSQMMPTVSSPPLSTLDMFQGPQWVPKTTDSTKPCIHYVFSYSKVQFIN